MPITIRSVDRYAYALDGEPRERWAVRYLSSTVRHGVTGGTIIGNARTTLDDLWRQQMEELNDIPLSFESPESSSLKGASYDPDCKQLTVEFKDGKTYDYPGIEPQMWIQFMEAGSKGSYFMRNIRPMHTGKKRE